MLQEVHYAYILEKLSEEIKVKFDSDQKRHYLTEAQRQAYLVQYSDTGLLVDHNQQPLSGKFIYAMDDQGELYVASEDVIKHHSYFLAGAPVLCAGVIEIQDGVIKTLSNESGHYKPGLENLSAAAKKILGKNNYRSFTCWDHASLNKSELTCYQAKKLITATPSLLECSSITYVERSRFKSTGLCQHKSKDFRLAEKIRLERKNNTVTFYTAAQTALHNLVLKLLSRKALPNTIDDINTAHQLVAEEAKPIVCEKQNSRCYNIYET